MRPRTRPRHASLGAAIALLFLGVALPGGPGPALAAAATPHAPILIDGDSDLCDDEDGDGQVGKDDGIVNCATANGSAEAPYVVEGWSFAIWDRPACLDGYVSPVPPTGCDLPVGCAGDTHKGAVVVCGTTKHLVLRDLAISWGTPVGACTPPGGPLDPVPCEEETRQGESTSSSALNLVGNERVVVQNVALDSQGVAVRVVRSPPAMTTRFEDLILSSKSPESAVGASADHGSESNLGNPPAVVIEDASVEFVRSRINATAHEVGILATATARGPYVFSFVGSTLESPWTTGIAVEGDFSVRVADSLVRDVGLEDAGLYLEPRADQVDEALDDPALGSTSIFPARAMYFAVDAAPLVLQGNWIQVRGFGVEINGNGTAVLEGNHFFDDAGQKRVTEVALQVSTYCEARLNFNSLDFARVLKLGRTCELDARFNWWGRETGPLDSPQQPQASGPVNVEPWLQRPLEELPVIAVESPRSGAQHAGRVEVKGTAVSPTQSEIVRVEMSDRAQGWDDPGHVAGTNEWSFLWDLSDEPLGPLSRWIRACDSRDCGLPARLDIVNVEQRAPPVAILRASPRVVAPGQALLLDASGSYSPQGHALAAYRFDLGDGRATDWSGDPRLETSFEEAGTYTVTVQVRDDANVTNANTPSVTVRVVGDTLGAKGAGLGTDLPAPGVALALLALLLGARWRRPRA